jgi:SAM-dependent methyltransferase
MGYEAAGLDYSDSLVRYVREKYSAEVYLGDPETALLPHRFDIAVMSHMLEHTADPIATLRHVRGLLNPGGLIYVAVPNVDCWDSHFRGWGSYEPYHLWYFNPDNLRYLLGKVGYQVVDIHTWEPYSAWLNTAVRSLMPWQHAAARRAVHRDYSGRLRYPFLIAMAIFNVARFVSGLAFTPLRLIQEHANKGEELIAIAINPDDWACSQEPCDANPGEVQC